MSPDMIQKNINVDHVRPIFSFDISIDEELKEAFNWKSIQLLLERINLPKGTGFNFLHYQLQFIRAY